MELKHSKNHRKSTSKSGIEALENRAKTVKRFPAGEYYLDMRDLEQKYDILVFESNCNIIVSEYFKVPPVLEAEKIFVMPKARIELIITHSRLFTYIRHARTGINRSDGKIIITRGEAQENDAKGVAIALNSEVKRNYGNAGAYALCGSEVDENVSKEGEAVCKSAKVYKNISQGDARAYVYKTRVNINKTKGNGDAVCEESTVDLNTTHGSGNALANNSEVGTNIAKGSGDAIMTKCKGDVNRVIGDGTATATDSQLRENKTQGSGNAYVKNCKLSSNIATGNGKAIIEDSFAESNKTQGIGDALVKNSKLKENKTHGKGDAIADSSTLETNMAAASGRAIVKHSKLLNNIANYGDAIATQSELRGKNKSLRGRTLTS